MYKKPKKIEEDGNPFHNFVFVTLLMLAFAFAVYHWDLTKFVFGN